MYLRSILLLFLLVIGLAACANTPRKVVFALDVDNTQAAHLMFPPQIDGVVPRYVYVGHLYGDRNFPDLEPKREGLFQMIGRALEFIKGETPPRELYRPQSGVVDEAGRILVTDRGNPSVFVFNEKDLTLQVWQQAEGSRNFVSPIGIALGPEGTVFVADSELGFVVHLDSQGNSIGTIGKGHLTRPTGVAYEPSSRRIFVVDTADHQIKLFDPQGKLLDVWGERGEGPAEFNFPTHISVSNQKLYLADTINARIQTLSTVTGKHLASVGRLGTYIGNMVRPKGVAADSEGNIYVIESFHDYLLIYNSSGEFLMSIGGVGTDPGKFHLPSGVWVDARNRIFVADTLNSRVSVFQFLGGGTESE